MAERNDEYLYILDFSDCTLCEIEIKDEDKTLDTYDLLAKYGCKIDNCNYMYSPIRLNVINLNDLAIL